MDFLANVSITSRAMPCPRFLDCNFTLEMNNGSEATTVATTTTVTKRDVMLQQTLVPLVFGVIFLVGLLGNSTLVYSVLRHKKLHNAPNIFIVSLALGDLLLLLVSVPFSATVFTFASWPYGQAVCKLNEFLQTLSLGVSVFTLTALAGDRYTAIMYPMKKMGSAETTRTIAIAGGIWILSLLLALPDAVAAHTESFPNHTTVSYCTPHPSNWGMTYVRSHILVRFFVYFLIPLTIICVLYALMARVLVLSSRKMPGEGQAQKQLQARKKVARLVLGFVLVFALCWLPRHTYLMWYAFGNRRFTMFWLVTKIAGFCLAFLNSCLNPLALYLLSKRFRRLYNQYLCCCCCFIWSSGDGAPAIPDGSVRMTSDLETPQSGGTTYNFSSNGRGRCRSHQNTRASPSGATTVTINSVC